VVCSTPSTSVVRRLDRETKFNINFQSNDFSYCQSNIRAMLNRLFYNFLYGY